MGQKPSGILGKLAAFALAIIIGKTTYDQVNKKKGNNPLNS